MTTPTKRPRRPGTPQRKRAALQRLSVEHVAGGTKCDGCQLLVPLTVQVGGAWLCVGCVGRIEGKPEGEA